jgi:hypothetical protein
MHIERIFRFLTESPVGTAMREYSLFSYSLFSYIECVHVLALSVVVGSIAAVDLRLLGLASTGRPISQLSKEVLPITWAAFACAVGSGGLLFTSHATEYIENPFFLIKTGLLAIAGVNVAIFHLVTERSRAAWDETKRPPPAVRWSGGLSLLLWIGVVVCGRWIGFYDPRLH